MQVAGALVGGCGCTMGAQNCGRPAGAGRCRAPSRRDRRAFDKAARRRSELVASIGARLAAARLASLATCALQLCRGRSGWADVTERVVPLHPRTSHLNSMSICISSTYPVVALAHPLRVLARLLCTRSVQSRSGVQWSKWCECGGAGSGA